MSHECQHFFTTLIWNSPSINDVQNNIIFEFHFQGKIIKTIVEVDNKNSLVLCNIYLLNLESAMAKVTCDLEKQGVAKAALSMDEIILKKIDKRKKK